MNILKNSKIPEFKIPKFKFENLSEFENIKIKFNKENISLKEKYSKRKYKRTNYKTVKEIFENSTRLYKDKEFILENFNGEKFEEISYGKFRDDVISLGTALTNKLNLKKERIAIIGENTYEWYVSYMSLLCSGNISVNLDKDIPDDEIVNLVTRSKVSAIIYSKKKAKNIDEIKEKLTGVKYFIEMYKDDEIRNMTNKSKYVGFDKLIKIGKVRIASGDNSFMNIRIDENEFKVLIFTSGTTSKSKGVMISNKNLVQNINSISVLVKLYPKDRLFSVLPLHHTYESTIGFILPMANGCSIAVCQGLRYLIDDVNATKPTAMLAVPLLIEKLYKKINESIKKSKKDKIVNSMMYITNVLKYSGIDIRRIVFKEILDNFGGNLRIIVSAAAPIDAKIIKWFEDIGMEMLQGYGLTETAPIAALTPEYDRKAGSVGRAVDCATIKILNPNEDGEGELLIKSDTLMLGYFEDEKLTKEVIKDGWFYSGDIGYIDDKGNIFITGRCKNVIVTKNGKNIYPEELELLVGKLKEVKECVIYGKKSEIKDDLVITASIFPNFSYIKKKYLVESSDTKKIEEILKERIDEINENLPLYKNIKKVEIKETEFAKTTTMKIKR